ncbi:dinucleotide-utilizing protein [Pseudonocardiaceae bacterium YIM PH 21723]|nr:dinucleotide-utilizing protein [Pseudonocardiaceae bacterium YIM PH 21723]
MRRPVIKVEHRPVRHGTDRIRIGGSVPGSAMDIADPDGRVWALLMLLDGSRTVGQVITDLAHAFPAVGEQEVREDLDQLIGAGYLEDAAAPIPANLSPLDIQRYSRGNALTRWMDRLPRSSSWEVQSGLRQASVVVVGLGGVGSTAALDLVMSGVGRVHCVEPDVVELSNLNRQVLYTEDDLGRAKADVAVRRLRSHNSDVVVTGERLTITGPDTLDRVIAGHDVLLMAADKPEEIRSWANRACLAAGIGWAHGSYHGPRINVGLYRPGQGACYDCANSAENDRLAAMAPRTFWGTGDGVPDTHPANAVSAGMAGHLVAHAVLSLLTGVPALPTNRQYSYNLLTLLDSEEAGPAQPWPGCPACGDRAA